MSQRFTCNGLAVEIERPLVMGILNLTPDSFSDGGQFNSVEKALDHVKAMVRDGADIIDLGAESTRPGSQPIGTEEELDRLLPVLRRLPRDQFLVSVDSCKPEVQAAAMGNGAHIVNDILGGTEALFALAQKHRCGVVCMHTPAPPASMQGHTEYADVAGELCAYFESKHAILSNYDLPRYWVDPGIGFGKTPQQSVELMRHAGRFCGDGWGLLVGASRKSWIGHAFGADVESRLGGSIAAALHCAAQGAEILRVHDVKETTQALATAHLLR